MKLLFINEGIFEPHKSPVERGECSYLYYMLREFRKLVMTSKNVKNTHNLIR